MVTGRTPDSENAQWHYWIVSQLQADFDCITWGLAVGGKDGLPIETIPDISPNKQLVGQLAELFNQEALEPVHFWDAVQDFLAWPERLERIVCKNA